MLKQGHYYSKLTQIITRRSISIQQAPTSIKVVSDTISNISSISDNVEQLPTSPTQSEAETLASSETPVFQTVGQTQSTLSLTLPPSLPIHIKRGSLISLYTSPTTTTTSPSSSEQSGQNDTLSSTLDINSPITRLFQGGITSSYQRLISTVPTNLLISAYTSTATGRLASFFTRTTETTKTFCNVTLDGTTDWALFQPRCLHLYAGTNLSIKTGKVPIKVTRRGISKFGLPKASSTGLRNYGWFGSGYILCSGRGYAGIVGTGSVFQLSLEEGESILVKRDNLLGCSLLDKSELESGFFVGERLSSGISANKKENEESDVEEDDLEIVINKDDAPSKEPVVSKGFGYIKNVFSRLKSAKDDIYEGLIVGNGDFVRVRGPRVLLIQTNTGFSRFVVNNRNGLTNHGVAKVEKFIKSKKDFKNPERTSEDFLSYATVKDGKVEFRSTPNFNETVEYIESLKAKKN